MESSGAVGRAKTKHTVPMIHVDTLSTDHVRLLVLCYRLMTRHLLPRFRESRNDIANRRLIRFYGNGEHDWSP